MKYILGKLYTFSVPYSWTINYWPIVDKQGKTIGTIMSGDLVCLLELMPETNNETAKVLTSQGCVGYIPTLLLSTNETTT